MKSKKHLVPTDQDYIGNVNLITGAKFNYDRQLATQEQVRQLCIPQSKDKVQKFMQIFKEGDKIQKWASLENLKYYCYSIKMKEDNENSSIIAEIILETLSKNYPQLYDYLSIMAEGIFSILSDQNIKLNQNSQKIIHEITYRTLTNCSAEMGDWQQIFEKTAKNFDKQQIDKCYQYIRGAFQMNSSPEKRRSALIMISGLFEVHHLQSRQYHKEIEKEANSKVLFFNSDQNPKTRETISTIMYKLLQKKPRDEEVWKSVWEYYDDKQISIKKKAIIIIFNIYSQTNLKHIMNSIFHANYQGNEGEVIENIVLLELGTFLQTYYEDIKAQTKIQMEIIAFCNRILKNDRIVNICLLLDCCGNSLLKVMGEARIFSEVNFNCLRIKQPYILAHLFPIYSCLEEIEFKENIKFMVFKGLKQNKYECYLGIKSLVSLLQLSIDDEINIYYSMLVKFLENSKWNQIQEMLSVFKTLKIYQNMYDKFCLLLLRIWLASPAFLLPILVESVIYLMLLNRRSLEFLITIREKLVNAKCWTYRSHYIQLYAAIKIKSSFDYQKLVPTLIYKNIINEKSYGVKLTFLKAATDLYKYTQPENTNEKTMIRDTVNKLTQDKDKYVRNNALNRQKSIQKLDKNSSYLYEIYRRNEQLIEKQQNSFQVLPEPKRTIKTQNQIRKCIFKKKVYMNTIENRRATNIIRQPHNTSSNIHKDVSIDNISLSSNRLNKGKMSNVQINEKRSNLFRCHSVKMKSIIKK